MFLLYVSKGADFIISEGENIFLPILKVGTFKNINILNCSFLPCTKVKSQNCPFIFHWTVKQFFLFFRYWNKSHSICWDIESWQSQSKINQLCFTIYYWHQRSISEMGKFKNKRIDIFLLLFLMTHNADIIMSSS